MTIYNIKKNKIKLYDSDTFDSFKIRISCEFNTIPDFVFITEKGYKDIEHDDLVIKYLKKKGDKLEEKEYEDEEEDKEDEDKEEVFDIFILSQYIKKKIKKGDDHSIHTVFKNIPEKYKKILKVLDFIKLYIYYYKKYVKTKDDDHIIMEIDLFITNLEELKLFSSTDKELTASELFSSSDEFKKNYTKKIKENKEKSKKLTEFSIFEENDDESNKSSSLTSFITIGKEYIYQTNCTVEEEENEEEYLINLFNNLSLNKNTLLCFYKDFFKINTDYKNIKLDTSFIQDKLDKMSRKYKKGKKIRDCIYVLLRKDSISPKKSDIDIEVDDEINWETNSFYIKIEIIDNRISLGLRLDKYINKEKVTDVFFSILPDYIKEKNDIDIYKIIEKDINGVFYVLDNSFNNYILAELILNNSPYNLCFNKRESDKTTKQKQGLSLHFKNPKNENISIPFTVISKKVSQNDPELVQYIKEDDKIKELIKKKERTYIRVYVSKINPDDIIYFMKIISKIFNLYEQDKKKVIKFYKKYISSFTEDIVYPEIKKTKGKIYLRQLLPEIFTETYTRKCQKTPSIVNIEEKEYYKNKNTIFFPRDGDKNLIREYVCLYDDFKYPGLKANNAENKNIYPVVPCCYKNDQTDKKIFTDYYSGKDMVFEKTLQTQLEIKTVKFVSWSNVGTLEYFPILNKLFESIDPENIYKRIGVSENPSSFLECILSSLNKMGDKLDENERIEKVENERGSIILDNNFLSLCKQTMYNLSDDQIKSILKDTKKYLDPSLFLPLFERIYEINIYLFCYKDKDYTMTTPSSSNGYISYDKIYEKSIYILENKGSESDNFLFPRCELIVRKPRFITQEEILYYFHPNIPTAFKLNDNTKQKNFGNGDELFLKNLNLEKIKVNSSEPIIVYDSDKHFSHLILDGKHTDFSLEGELKEIHNQEKKFKNLELKLPYIKYILKYKYENDVKYIIDKEDNIFELCSLNSSFKIRKFYTKISSFNYKNIESGIISGKILDVLTKNYKPILQFIDSHGKARYINLKNESNNRKISIYTIPLPPLECPSKEKDISNFKFYNSKKKSIEEIINFITNNGFKIISKKLDLNKKISEIELFLYGITFYIPFKFSEESEDEYKKLEKITSKIEISKDIKKSLSGKKYELDIYMSNKKTSFFLKDYFIYLYSTWCNYKKISVNENIKLWIDEQVKLKKKYTYKIPLFTNFKKALENKTYLDKDDKFIANSKELLIRLIYNLQLSLKRSYKDVEQFYKKKVKTVIFEKTQNIEVPEQSSNQILLKGLFNLYQYIQSTIIYEKDNVYYSHYQKTSSTYIIKIEGTLYKAYNASSLNNAIYLSTFLSNPENLKKLEKKEEYDNEFKEELSKEADSSTKSKVYLYENNNYSLYYLNRNNEDEDIIITSLVTKEDGEIIYTCLIKI
jgi:hypothetical protein